MEEVDFTESRVVSGENLGKRGKERLKRANVRENKLGQPAENNNRSPDTGLVGAVAYEDLCQHCKETVRIGDNSSPLRNGLTVRVSTVNRRRVLVVDANKVTINNNVHTSCDDDGVTDDTDEVEGDVICRKVVAARNGSVKKRKHSVNRAPFSTAIDSKVNVVETLLEINKCLLPESLMEFCLWYSQMLKTVRGQDWTTLSSFDDAGVAVIRGLVDLDLEALIMDTGHRELLRMNKAQNQGSLDVLTTRLREVLFVDNFLSDVIHTILFLITVAAVFYMFVHF